MTGTNPAYLEIKISCEGEMKEILAVVLMEHGFEGTWEHDNGLSAYIPADQYDETAVLSLLSEFGLGKDDLSATAMADVNWNQEWESEYEDILVDKRCHIRADFHVSVPEVEYDIIIQPKMSFGTGHHDTTYLMVKAMLDMDLAGKRVLDVGCGTGVLAILAAMKKAAHVLAIDNHAWSYENTLENAKKNHVDIEVRLTDIESFDGKGFDIILANINRNINHDQLGKYAEILLDGGILLMSGYFAYDHEYVHNEAIKHGFLMLDKKTSDKGWTAVSYQKQLL